MSRLRTAPIPLLSGDIERNPTKCLDRAISVSSMTRLRRWPYTFAMALSLLVGAVAVASSLYLDLPLQDPDGFLGPSYIRLPLLALGFGGSGLLVAAVPRTRVASIRA